MKIVIKKSVVYMISLIVFVCTTVKTVAKNTAGEKDPGQLYALSAVLLDGESGRVLYEKDGYTKRPMASTTKIMTCIIALEKGNLSDLVTVSRYAASMPDVQLNMREGEKYVLEDLLYSLMLESHNDTAVAIAEYIGGTVENFADMMNDKAKEIGCTDTCFITPNGLDATKEIDGKVVEHSTTARDLALIMSYCIKNDDFLRITRTSSKTFADKEKDGSGKIINGKRVYTVTNRNAFLKMMDGVISGKTGFTGNAGYCYVCAFENDGRIYTLALLGCGWPNNKNYKWSDSKKLLNFGMENYFRKDIFNYDMELPDITVHNGVYGCYDDLGIYGINADKKVTIKPYINKEPLWVLCNSDGTIEPHVFFEKELKAPVYKGQVIGWVTYEIDGNIQKIYEIHVEKTVEEKDFEWSFGCIFMRFIMH